MYIKNYPTKTSRSLRPLREESIKFVLPKPFAPAN